MKELIAGRILKVMKDEEGNEVQRSPAEIMAEAILEGMEGKLVISRGEKSITYANPLYAVKLFQDYMLKSREQAIKRREAKNKKDGSSGGIRVVLLNPVADPLLRPGQKPPPLRLLGQDPSKPLPDATGTATDARVNRRHHRHGRQPIWERARPLRKVDKRSERSRKTALEGWAGRRKREARLRATRLSRALPDV